MRWLKTEVEKKQQQQYLEERLRLYQERCVPLRVFARYKSVLLTVDASSPCWCD